MACCSEYQTECLKVVTIGYLKDFIGSNIQNSTGGTVYVSDTYTDNRYCPTFTELTNGSILPVWNEGASSPRGDTDGILITGAYESKQLVRQQDLVMRYTRFNTLSISSDRSSGLNECGDSATITTTYNYNRYTKKMNSSSCAVTSSTSRSDGACGELTWHTLYGSVTKCSDYTIGKNGTVSATSRCDKISATTTFRGASKSSNEISICQNALTGSYSVYATDRKVMTGITCTASPSSLKVYGNTDGSGTCTVNQEVSLIGTGRYDKYTTYYWKDSCGVVYNGGAQGVVSAETKTVEGGTESAGTDRYTFNFTQQCCTGGTSQTHTLRVTYGDKVCSSTFTGICQSCEDECSTACCKVVGDTSIYCSGSAQYTVKDCEEPEDCKVAIVDGNRIVGTTNEQITGEDSSYITPDARFFIEVYDNYNFAHPEYITGTQEQKDIWEADLANRTPTSTGYSTSTKGTVLNVTVGASHEGDCHFWYDNSSCVGARLVYAAGELDRRPLCMDHDCNWECYSGGRTCDPECYGDAGLGGWNCDAAYNEYLRYTSYLVAQNDNSSPRLTIAYWYKEGYDYKRCPSKRNIFYQTGR